MAPPPRRRSSRRNGAQACAMHRPACSLQAQASALPLPHCLAAARCCESSSAAWRRQRRQRCTAHPGATAPIGLAPAPQLVHSSQRSWNKRQRQTREHRPRASPSRKPNPLCSPSSRCTASEGEGQRVAGAGRLRAPGAATSDTPGPSASRPELQGSPWALGRAPGVPTDPPPAPAAHPAPAATAAAACRPPGRRSRAGCAAPGWRCCCWRPRARVPPAPARTTPPPSHLTGVQRCRRLTAAAAAAQRCPCCCWAASNGLLCAPALPCPAAWMGPSQWLRSQTARTRRLAGKPAGWPAAMSCACRGAARAWPAAHTPRRACCGCCRYRYMATVRDDSDFAICGGAGAGGLCLRGPPRRSCPACKQTPPILCSRPAGTLIHPLVVMTAVHVSRGR